MVTDEDYMRRALFHAARARAGTTPNPMVGAVVVSPDGLVVGQGRHLKAGGAHAEVHALDEAGERARGATMYVTLEPCCHHGRTAPCTQRVIASGVRRVVVAMPDPNPLVNGRGIAEMRAAGVQVEVGLLEREARDLNRGFIRVHTAGRPEVIVKAGVSADGMIAEAPGHRTTISGPASWRRIHRLRAMVDAIAVGSETLLVDDPLLTARESVRPRPLTRVVFDRRLRTPVTSALVRSVEAGPVLILTTAEAMAAHADQVEALRRLGVTVVNGGASLAESLHALLAFDVSTLLVEGGARLHRALLDADLVDQILLVTTPGRTLGPRGVPAFGTGDLSVGGRSPNRTESVGDDLWMEFDVHGNH
jgi:diaminohydroxyphosphoribosylaminopyrimidine deaminase/5-amino-6-(5-phosphoribosylamino)uracil reductase